MSRWTLILLSAGLLSGASLYSTYKAPPGTIDGSAVSGEVVGLGYTGSVTLRKQGFFGPYEEDTPAYYHVRLLDHERGIRGKVKIDTRFLDREPRVGDHLDATLPNRPILTDGATIASE